MKGTSMKKEAKKAPKKCAKCGKAAAKCKC